MGTMVIEMNPPNIIYILTITGISAIRVKMLALGMGIAKNYVARYAGCVS